MTQVSVIAPSDLVKGYSLSVDIDGKATDITCPRDVRKGEAFEGTKRTP